MKSNSKTKVLQIVTLFSIGGATETVISIAKGLKLKGYDVDIITGPELVQEGSLIDDALKEGLEIKIIKKLKRGINPFYDFVTFIYLIFFIKKNKYTIVHTHSSKAGILGRWAAFFSGVKIIFHTVHGWGFNDFQKVFFKKILVLIEKNTAKITTKLICVTKHDISKGIKLKIGNTEKYIVIRSGIDFQNFIDVQFNKQQYYNEFNIPLNSVIIGTVTRFSPQKAPFDTLDAFLHVSKKLSNTYLMMVGDGPLLRKAKEFSEKFSLTDKIIFTGIRRDIPQLMKVMDIFVLSSVWEGLPRVLLQAIVTGLPIIATNIDGNSEIINNNINGKLVSPGNPFLLGETILELLSNKELLLKLSKSSRKTLIEYSEEKMIYDIDMLYCKYLQLLDV